MSEDAELFERLAGMGGKSQVGKANQGHKFGNALEFWRQVPSKYIKMLEEPFAYKYDFELFGYSINDYAEQIGLKLT